MGRREKQLEPADGPVQAFAHELRTLRRKSGGITYRDMAARSEYSSTTLAQAASGERLPSLPVVLAYVAACDGELEEWERRWHEVARSPQAVPVREDDGSAPPYRGLARFDPEHHDLFFGRAQLVEQAVGFIRGLRFTALVGASGAGKSSLLRAGVVPALRAAGTGLAAVRLLTPGEHPYREHAKRLVPAEGPGDTLVVVDQFEELFTLCTDTQERDRFLGLLLGEGGESGEGSEGGGGGESGVAGVADRLRVVIAVRADFYDRLAAHPVLAAVLREGTLLVGPMTPAELREAVVRPAAKAGLLVERTLTARVVDEVMGEPGCLPLMSHALLETWRRRHGRTLDEAAYDAAGGLRGALSQTAETVYQEFTPAEARLARSLLLRLITPGEGAQDTRRPTDRAELPSDAADVLDRLVRARLLTLDGTTVDLAHEALITAWPRLRRWVDAERQHLRVHRRLTEAAQVWDQLDREKGGLYRGAPLNAAQDTFAEEERRDGLTTVERDFLDASSAGQEAERRQAVRSTRRLRGLVSALSVLVVLTLVAAGVAYAQSRSARAEQQRALSRQLAAQAALLRDTDTDISGLLAAYAYRISPTREAVAGLQAVGDSSLMYRMYTENFYITSLAFSPAQSGGALAVSDQGGVTAWWKDGEYVRRLNNLRADESAGNGKRTEFSANGLTLAVFTDRRKVELIDQITGFRRVLVTPENGSTSLVLRPDGNMLAVGPDRWVKDAVTQRPLFRIQEAVSANPVLAVSADDRLLAVGGDAQGDEVRIVDLADGGTRATIGLDRVPAGPRVLLLSPDGKSLAVSDTSGVVSLWDTETGAFRVVLASTHRRVVDDMVFSPDGKAIVTADDADVRMWDTATGRLLASYPGHTDVVTSLAFSPDGRAFASGDASGVTRQWRVTEQSRKVLTDPGNKLRSLALTGDGHTLAVIGERSDGKPSARLWDVTKGTAAGLDDVQYPSVDNRYSVDFSPDGRTVVVTDGQGARLWDVATRRPKPVWSGAAKALSPVLFGPDSEVLFVPSEGRVEIRDVRDGRDLGRLENLDVSTMYARDLAISKGNRWLYQDSDIWDLKNKEKKYRIRAGRGIRAMVAFSPDGRTLVTGDSGGIVTLWDLDKGQPVRSIPRARGLSAVAFGQEGNVLATVGVDRVIRVWDVTTGQLRRSLHGHTAAVTSMEFAAEGGSLASADENGTVRLWDVAFSDPADTVDTLCKAIGRDLTGAERDLYLPGGFDARVCDERFERSGDDRFRELGECSQNRVGICAVEKEEDSPFGDRVVTRDSTP